MLRDTLSELGHAGSVEVVQKVSDAGCYREYHSWLAVFS